MLDLPRSNPGRGTQICGMHLHRASGAQDVLPREGLGVTAGQLVLPSQTPLSIIGCGRLLFVAAHSATSVSFLHVVGD